MSQYRFLQDAYVGMSYFAGTTASTADILGGTLPVNWVPGPYVDPLDNAAITAFWNAGPQVAPLARVQWTTIPVVTAAVYWQVFNLALTQYQLTGAGAALGPRCAGIILGNLP
jgi:hypothetical protein